MPEATSFTTGSLNSVDNGDNFLFSSLQTGFVFNINMLMHQMVSGQHALQQVLTAATARSVTEITNNPSVDAAVFQQSVDIVLKAIQESASLHMNMMRQLTEEIVKCSSVAKQKL